MPIADVLAQTLPAAGTLLGGPVGGAVGTFASGLIQGDQANKARDAYDKYEKTIPQQDPEQIALRGKIQRRRTMLEAGTDAYTQNRIANANNANAQTQLNIRRAGGGVSDLLRSESATNQAIGNAGADAQRGALNLLGIEGQLTASMADRLYQRQDSRANMLWQEFARRREDANRTINATIGLLPQLSITGEDGQPFQGLIGAGRRNMAGRTSVLGTHESSHII